MKDGEGVGSLPTAPTRDGYTFEGWNTKADGSGNEFEADTKVTENISVYAVWQEIALPQVGDVTVTTKVGGVEVTDLTALDNGDVVTVRLATSTSGTEIYFTVDGTDPATSATRLLYDPANKPRVGTIKTEGMTVTVKAVGLKSGLANSSTVTKGFTFIPGGEFAGGNGDLSKPYQVATAAQLHNVRNYLDAYFKQIEDIDLDFLP